MTVLADRVSVRGRFARSVNLERDADQVEPFDGYIVTARALDAVGRIASVAAAERSGGAWSLTGPYGSGKSSLALLLDAIFGPDTSAREIAWKLVDQASSSVGERIRQAHLRWGTQEAGFHRGIATACREPLNQTVLRALDNAVLRTYGATPSPSEFPAARTLTGLFEDATGSDLHRRDPSPTALVESVRCLAERAPVLLIIDEFGKNLEAVGDSGGTDPYLLQQLAELGQGAGLPIFVLTLQHLSFEDHLNGAAEPELREWAKVQGRFEDISYVESASATRALISTAFEVSDDKFGQQIRSWADLIARDMEGLGIADLSDAETVAACYPLHPLVVAVLPELCNRYGQHERTLFSFLAGREPSTVASRLAETKLTAGTPLPSIGLETVYDYFVTSGTVGHMASGRSSRWNEIATRLRDTYGLSERQTRLAKSLALLNLVSTSGAIRASSEVLARTDPDADSQLDALDKAGLITYRDFADEYRIWEGTDIDIAGLLETTRRSVQQQPLIAILSGLDQPVPVVAARHSAEHDTLRVFDRRYFGGRESIQPLDAFSPYDGEALLVVGSDRPDQRVPAVPWEDGEAKPVVAAIPHDVGELDEAARESAAVSAALRDPDVQADRVAKRELGERLAEANTAVDRALATIFSPDACRWIMLDKSGGTELKRGRGSAALSDAADRAYPNTPAVRNEMLNRTALTTQGAKARRLLLEAMIERGSEPGLGLVGYGPEVAMYEAFLKQTGLHGPDKRNGTMVFRGPRDDSSIGASLKDAWRVLEDEFKRAKTKPVNLRSVSAVLRSPPIGMKGAVVPVFVTAALLAFREEIAIYEHGTFKPLLTPDLSERMVRNPHHFDIRHFANTTGGRRQVVAALAGRLGVRPGFRKHRVANVLSVVAHLVGQVTRLNRYVRKTKHLPAETLEVREALVTAVEPDELLFRSLPTALGFDPVRPDGGTYANADAYAARVATAIEELVGCYDRLLNDLLELLLATSMETTRKALAEQAASLDVDALDPSMRAFVLTLSRDAADSDMDWIETVATVVAQKAPAEWTDADLSRFRDELPRQVGILQRLVALHADHPSGAGAPGTFRVTVTRSDGSELVRLVRTDQDQRQEIRQALGRTLDELCQKGSRRPNRQTMLALLVEQLLAAQSSGGKHGRLPSKESA